MTKNVFQNENMLSYVDEKHDQVYAPLPNSNDKIAKPRRTNGLAITAIVLAGLSGIGSLVIVPAVVAIGFSVAALVMSIKRGTSKVLSIVALSISTFFLIFGALFLAFVFNAYQVDEPPVVPANYATDYFSGLAYKYTPPTQVQCDANGNCALSVDLIATSDSCVKGGTASQEMMSTQTGISTGEVTAEIPALKKQDTSTVTFTYTSQPNDVLLFASSPNFTCL